MTHEYELRREKLGLVDPIASHELLNAATSEILTSEMMGADIQFVISEMRRIAAGKDEEGGAQMVGLAAPQLGVAKRIAIIDTNAGGVERQEQAMRVLINPRIVQASEEMVDGREGCWSCDDFCANVPREAWIEIEAYDEHGEMFHERLEGFTARIAQHEIDHLDGIRCIDRVPEDEPERLHLVHKDNPAEFERYRKEWATWDKHFEREEWERFREGKDTIACII